MEIFQKFGFEPALYIGQIVNFLIIFYLFQRFLYKPLLKMMEERSRKIKSGLEAAEKANDVLFQANSDREQILKKTTKDSESILEEAKKLAEKNKDEILTEAKIQASRIIENAKLQTKFEEENVIKNLKIISLELSKKMLKTILPNLLTQEEQKSALSRASKMLDQKN